MTTDRDKVFERAFQTIVRMNPNTDRWTTPPGKVIRPRRKRNASSKKKREDELSDQEYKWTAPFGVIRNAQGKVIYDPVPPSKRKRRDKVVKAWAIKDPVKRRARLVQLGMLPEKST